MNYIFEHAGKQYAPDGVTTTVIPTTDHNKAIEQAELERWASKPDYAAAYVTEHDGALSVDTWLGTTLGTIVRSHTYRDGFGHRMRSIRVQGTNGATYFGKYGYDWSQLVRLRRAKS